MTDKGLRIIPFTSNINEVKPTSTSVSYTHLQKKCEHIQSEEGSRCIFRQSGISATVNQEQTVYRRLSAVIEALTLAVGSDCAILL